MTKTQNLDEFQSVISKLNLPDFNVVYADRDHHIYYVSNAKLPIRNSQYDWKNVLPGDTSAILWTQYHTYEELPS
jgi:acyl-homoserine-lactone acylase